jgi:transcriptional regulator with PAS, ATPase and Fis domain
MNKRIAIVSYDRESAFSYREQLEALFKDNIDIELHSMQDNSIININADLILASTPSLYEIVKKQVENRGDIIIADITLKKDALQKIMDIPINTKALLVNINGEMAIDTIALIYQHGISHVDFLPYYPGKKEIPEVDIAVTPAETKYVPPNIKEVIDLGHRVLSQKTIVDIATKLDLSFLLQTNDFLNFFQNIVVKSHGMEDLLDKTNLLGKQMDILLQILDDGIIGLTSNGIVCFLNDNAEKIINIEKDIVIGEHIENIIDDYYFDEVISTKESIKGKVIKLNDDYVVLSIYPIIDLNNVKSYIILLKEFKDTEKQQHNIRKQILTKGHVAKYYFDDIVGTSDIILGAKKEARKMSQSNSSILIYGESGTGKELFAQAIHNSSNRSDYQFIAVNCGAIPENLLESELFGYAEGAFTGAKKGGKLGYFELAHKGTLFLDEINELAVGLQSRLLRVVQEREVVRIGGDKVINVDVRIISATNHNLKELVSNNEFRKDLYYRLNVLPLKIPSLRDRKEDLPVLIEYFKNQIDADFTLSDEVLNRIQEYKWEGNIRELRNFVERLLYIEKKEISINDCVLFLPENAYEIVLSEYEKNSLSSFKRSIWGNVSKYLFILEELEKGFENKYRIGRRSLTNIAESRNIYLTEQEIRNILSELQLYKMVSISKGRGGTKITDFGLKALRLIRIDENKEI